MRWTDNPGPGASPSPGSSPGPGWRRCSACDRRPCTRRRRRAAREGHSWSRSCEHNLSFLAMSPIPKWKCAWRNSPLRERRSCATIGSTASTPMPTRSGFGRGSPKTRLPPRFSGSGAGKGWKCLSPPGPGMWPQIGASALPFRCPLSGHRCWRSSPAAVTNPFEARRITPSSGRLCSPWPPARS